jgi:transcriptional regulator with XRE-family HTH domain
MTFGDRLRKLRKQLDMTQEQVAKNLNIVRSTYAYYETGKTCPDFNTVVRLARLFNVTTDYLLNAEPTTNPSPSTPATLNDTSPNAYTPASKKAVGTEWSLRETEQKLLIAFRYLDKDAQNQILKDIERTAAERYEQRHNPKKEKEPLPGNNT